ncbi:MAG: amino acid permease [Kiritimatiellae bacterium]|nr:amino acid permease [Kiritimatiellia bacterium]
MMGLGMMIGAGVFIGVGNTIAEVGPGGVVLTFALNGVIALMTAMSFAELSSAIPRAGGAYNFARVAFNRGTSFLAGWMEWFGSSVAGSIYSLTFAMYVLHFLEQAGWLEWLPVELEVAERLVAVLAAGLFLYINYRGASETGRVGAFFTLGQTLFMVLIGVVGIVVAIRDPIRLQNFKPFLPHGWTKLLATMGFTYVAFEGYEVIAQAGDEAIRPRSNLPKAMLYSVLVVTLTYVSVAFATVVAVRPGASGIEGPIWQWIGSHGGKGFAVAIHRLMPMGSLLVTLAVIFASTSALNATIYSATRASYALGRDRMLPPLFARISRRRRTPWVALLFTGGIVLVVATVLPTRDVASSASIMFLFLFFMVNVCVIKIRLNMRDELTYGYLMPLFPLFPLVAIVAQAALAVWLVHMSWMAWIVAPAWIAAGIGIYWAYSRTRAVTTPHEIRVLEEETAPETGQYRIMVSVANPDNALGLVRHTHKLCEAKNARVELLHMVPVPDQVPLTDADRYMGEGKEGIVEVMMYLVAAFPVSTTLRYCRNIARGIVSAVREKKTDMLILGWHGQKRSLAFNLGSTIDPIIERAPCDVVIFKNCGDRQFKRILVPVAGGPHGALALEVASILAEREEGEVVAFTVRDPRRPFDIAAFVEQSRARLRLPAERVKTKVVEPRGVRAAILEEAAGYDLIVLGATEQPFFVRAARRSVPESVASLCAKPVVMVKASRGIKGWLKRWI